MVSSFDSYVVACVFKIVYKPSYLQPQQLMNSPAEALKDFSKLSVIGKGTYAKVTLVRHLKDNQLYALKELKKKYILEKNQEKHIMTEKEILAQIEHPFLVKMKMSFQDDRKLYFLLEYCPGGELFSLLATKDKLTEEQ